MYCYVYENTIHPKLLKKSRDASNMCLSYIPAKEYYEIKDVFDKGVSYILKLSKLSRFDTIHDFCSGHGANITHAIARNKAKYGIAYNIHAPKSSQRLWSRYPQITARMVYKEEDIYQTEYNLKDNSLVIGLHPCRGLALRICDIAIKNNSPVIITPCCIGRIDPFFAPFENIKKYDKWCLTIGQKLTKVGYNLNIRQIRKSATPVGTIIIGIPGDKYDR